MISCCHLSAHQVHHGAGSAVKAAHTCQLRDQRVYPVRLERVALVKGTHHFPAGGEEAGLRARAGEIVKLKRRDAAKAAEQDLNAQGWLPDWMVRTSPAAEAEEATETDAHTTDHAA